MGVAPLNYHPEVCRLAATLTAPQLEIVHELAAAVETHPDSQDLTQFWRIDEEIGGPGAYRWPRSYRDQPFRHGLCRFVYRPLHYAGCYIEKGLYDLARDAIHFSGMHLEAFLRVLLGMNKGPYRQPPTLGVCAREFSRTRQLPVITSDAIIAMVGLCNMGKHDTNDDPDRLRLFGPFEGAVGYLATRLVSIELLRLAEPKIREELRCPESQPISGSPR